MLNRGKRPCPFGDRFSKRRQRWSSQAQPARARGQAAERRPSLREATVGAHRVRSIDIPAHVIVPEATAMLAA
jgi:hypothetical protein